MFNGKSSLKTLIKYLVLRNYKKLYQIKNSILAQLHLIMEKDRFLKINYKQQTESKKVGDSSNCQTDSM